MSGEVTTRAGQTAPEPGWRARYLPASGPQRVLAVATFVSTVGSGLLMVASVLYFTRVVHLPPGQVGVGLTVAGLVGMSAGVPLGHLADRYGPRGVLIGSLVVAAATMVGYLWIRGFVGFLLVVSLDMLANAAANSARGALIRRVGGESAVAYRSQLRVVNNLGVSIGAVAAGWAIALDTPLAYQVLIVVNAATFLLCALLVYRLPRYEPLPRPPQGPRWGALSDRPFLAYTVLNGAMTMQFQVLLIPLPIWIASRTNAPLWSVAGIMVVNTALCVLLQVAVGSRVDTVPRGGAALRTAGLIFLVSCTMMAFVTDLPAWAALLALLVMVVLHTLGELWHMAATFVLGFELAPPHAQGQYQGLQGMGVGVGAALAPSVLTLLCITWGSAGWVLLGVWFLVLGLLGPAVAQWGLRTRPAVAIEPNRP